MGFAQVALQGLGGALHQGQGLGHHVIVLLIQLFELVFQVLGALVGGQGRGYFGRGGLQRGGRVDARTRRVEKRAGRAGTPAREAGAGVQ